MNSLKIGIVVADVDEYKTLADYISTITAKEYSYLQRKGHRFNVTTDNGTASVVSLLCGIGKVNAAAATAHLIDEGCNIILNYGLSGGIDGVRRGEIMICDRFLEHDFDLTGIGYKLCEKPGQKYIYETDTSLLKLFGEFLPEVKCGTAVTGDRFVCDEDLRIRLKTDFSAMSCDMETAAMAYVCDFSNTPFLALRRISDDAGDNAVDSYKEMNTSNETVLSDLIIDFCKKIIDSGLYGQAK